MLNLNVPDSLSLAERIRLRDRRIDASIKRRMRQLADEPEKKLSAIEDAVSAVLGARRSPRSGAWRTPTVAQALGVPSIQRAVSLISSTTGMLSMQGYRSGTVMDDPPRLIVRPDPDVTPYEFYSTTAAQMAKYGEFVWWIASRDGDGNPQALVNVPLQELHVLENVKDRRYPRYEWGEKRGLRWSPTNPTGTFVHKKYPIGEPFALRGEGPLQLGKVAISISVESQVWAANFYGGGGHPSDIIKHASELDPTLRDDMGMLDETSGLSEADRLKAQYISRDSNTPIVIDQRIESITPGRIDEAGAQMLEARLHQNGDAARLFGLPGKFVEYVQSGTSLTYQTLESAFTDLIRTCLQPLYLEPTEQAMSDLLPRSTVARFNVKGFLRADAKTRAEIYNLLVPLGVMTAAQAATEEGILPGDVEFAPVPFAPLAAIPGPIPRITASMLTVDWRCTKCDAKLLEVAGPGSRATCRRCKTPNMIELSAEPSASEQRWEIHNHFPADFVRVESPVNVHPPQINVAPPGVTISNPPITVTMPDTETRIAALGGSVEAFTAQVDGLLARQSIAHEESQARLTELAEANREVAAKLGESLKPRKVTPVRDENGAIVSMTTEAA